MGALHSTSVVVATVAWLLIGNVGRPFDRATRLRVATQLTCLGTMTAPLFDAGGGFRHSIIQVTYLAGAALALFTAGELRAWPIRSWWLNGLFGVALVAALLSTDPMRSVSVTIHLVGVAVLAASCARATEQAALRRVFVEFCVLVFAWFVLGAALAPDDTFTATRAPFYRYSVNLQPVGVFAMEVGIAGAALVVAGLHSIRRRWPLLLAGSALVLLPQKRLTVLATLLLGLVWVAQTQSRRFWMACAALVGVATLFASVPSLRQLWDRELAAPEAENAFSYRTEILEATLDRVAQHPVLGGGLGIGDRRLTVSIGRPGAEFATHGELETALAGTGLLGAGFVVAGYVDLLARGWRARRSGDWVPLGIALAMLCSVPFLTVVLRPVHSLPYLLFVLPLGPRRSTDETSAAARLSAF